MMKKYKIKVNGNEYDVEVEEIKENKVEVSTVSAPKANTTKTVASESKKSSSVPSGANTINSPMPGTILRVDLGEGDLVKNGQVVMILEAMKMENEITASKDGKIASVNVGKGDSVNAGDVLFSIE
jgi:biotin carboxyl carrier protein